MPADYMHRALSLARKALGTVSPNPAVGAVVVDADGSVVGEGYTQPPGQAHAEVVALARAGDRAQGASLYVTLEPCCHHGRTPPCTDAIIQSGIREVHMAMLDPNSLVSGKGKELLEAEGIGTTVGEGNEEAQDIVEAYAKHITTGLPFVTAKFAMSLDGKIATRKFDSKWISNDWSREHAHRARWETDAIMVGVNTVLKDDPQLTARTLLGTREPLRVIVDSRGQTPPGAKALQTPGRALIAATSDIELTRLGEYGDAGVEVLRTSAHRGRVDLEELLKVLGRREITSVLVEGGGMLLGSLFDLRLIDKVMAFISPIIIGGKDAVSPVGGRGVDAVSMGLRLKRVQLERFIDDIMIVGYAG